jgi:hypothetical protein
VARSAQKIYNLLRQVTSMEVVRRFLKSNGLAHSAGSWDDLYDKRIKPSLDAKLIDKRQLIQLLSDAEESGRQHVFLFSMSGKSARKCIDQSRIDTIIASLDLGDLPLILEKPENPTISDIRFDDGINGSALVVKVIGTRISKVKASDKTTATEQIIKYNFVHERTVNVLKIHETGLVELRIQSQSGASWDYTKEVQRLLAITAPILEEEFAINQLSLSKAKDTMWENRKSLSEKIRYTSSTLRDDFGISLRAATSKKEVNLTDNVAAEKSLNTFLSNDGYCEQSNVWFIKKEQDDLKSIHVLLEGNVNEFVLPTNCARADYEYVLSEILALNK